MEYHTITAGETKNNIIIIVALHVGTENNNFVNVSENYEEVYRTPILDDKTACELFNDRQKLEFGEIRVQVNKVILDLVRKGV